MWGSNNLVNKGQLNQIQTKPNEFQCKQGRSTTEVPTTMKKIVISPILTSKIRHYDVMLVYYILVMFVKLHFI